MAHLRWGRRLRDIPVLAADRVRFIGDRVAAVAAESREVAQRALELIEVEYEALPAVFDPLEAMRPDAPLLHPELRSYQGLPAQVADIPNVVSLETVSKGDVERGCAEAAHVFEHTFTLPAAHHAYLEPHACLVAPEPDGAFRVWASNKNPFLLRDQVAAAFGLAPGQVVIEPTFSGGDFGGKGSPMEVPVCLALARACGRPVKLVLDYGEELQAANPRHATIATMRTGVTRQGRLVAHHATFVFNSGAYAGYKPLPTGNLAASHHAAGVYRLPHARVDSYRVYTNQVPGGHMRAPGEVQATVALEVHLDMIARALGLDPLEFRLLNALEDGEEGPLVGRGTFSAKPPTHTAFGAQAAEVEVDAETGQVRVTRVVGVHDVGQPISYHGLTGRLEGGVAWGFGCGMMEELRIERGRVMTPTWATTRSRASPTCRPSSRSCTPTRRARGRTAPSRWPS